MTMHEARCVLLDAISYARWRKDEVPPASISEERVVQAIEMLWLETFHRKMESCDYAGMHIPRDEQGTIVDKKEV